MIGCLHHVMKVILAVSSPHCLAQLGDPTLDYSRDSRRNHHHFTQLPLTTTAQGGLPWASSIAPHLSWGICERHKVLSSRSNAPWYLGVWKWHIVFRDQLTLSAERIVDWQSFLCLMHLYMIVWYKATEVSNAAWHNAQILSIRFVWLPMLHPQHCLVILGTSLNTSQDWHCSTVRLT